MKSKFKDMDILRLIENQHNMTKGGLYCANQIFESNTDIPVIETVDDYGLVVSLYETSFEATDVVLDFGAGVAVKEQEIKMSIDEATFIVEETLDDCVCPDGYLVSHVLIAKIQTDKELQKALLVLMQSGSVEGSK